MDIPVAKWTQKDLPEHLKLRFSLVDSNGKVVCSGRDPNVLNGLPESGCSPNHLAEAKKKWEKTGLVTWEIGDLPEKLSIEGENGQILPAYPMLEPAEAGVNLRLHTDRLNALETHKKGVARLFSIYFANEIKHLKKNISLCQEMKNCAMHFGGAKAVESAVIENVVNSLFALNIRSDEQFHDHAIKMVNCILPAGRNLLEKIRPVMSAFREFRRRFSILSFNGSPVLVKRVESSLAGLVPENFITLYSMEQIEHLPRYMKALSLRLERGLNDPEKDNDRHEKIEKFRKKLNELYKNIDSSAPPEKKAAIEEYFWMVEEYKVSLFAQELKTAFRISEKRLAERYKEIMSDRL